MSSQQFQESLEKSLQESEGDRDQYLGEPTLTYPRLISRLTIIGLSLREFIHEFKYQTLVLLKCCLLQPKVLSAP